MTRTSQAKSERAAPASEIEIALADARRDAAEAFEGVSAAEAEYRAGLIALDEDALAAILARKNRAQITADRAAAMAEALETRLVEAREREAGERHIAAQRETEAKVAEAVKQLRTTYPRAVGMILGALEAVAEAQRSVNRFNAAAGEDGDHLDQPEAFRLGGFQPRQVLSEETVERWADPVTGEPLAEVYQAEVVESGRPGEGFRPSPTHSTVRDYDRPEFVRRLFIRREVLESASGDRRRPLASEIRLPALTAGALSWPGSDAPMSPEQVLGLIHRLRAGADAPAEDRPVVVEFVPIRADAA